MMGTCTGKQTHRQPWARACSRQGKSVHGFAMASFGGALPLRGEPSSGMPGGVPVFNPTDSAHALLSSAHNDYLAPHACSHSTLGACMCP